MPKCILRSDCVFTKGKYVSDIGFVTNIEDAKVFSSEKKALEFIYSLYDKPNERGVFVGKLDIVFIKEK